ncbi:NADP oxidoreductase [Xylanimonas oleitrophica]|uniref:NADP oxidoreductase n=1 Tax=Xylanimonas oleitrophica TaxID=2607479 RepID=A0A2W5WVH5_9MICO|nr:NAD(P)-binding domain-containing protein [Xylanimonas oleitrophica]PZR55307.1 NADP oxidoreductase [Xylanimonas oleitrophica]
MTSNSARVARHPPWRTSPSGRTVGGMAITGIIGSGHVGSTIARLALGAGDEVVLANSRGPETLQGLVEDLGPGASAATAAEAAARADLVVVSVPLTAFGSLPAAELAGKPVLDTCNYYPDRDGRIPELDSEETTTSELLARALPGAHVIKAFNNINFHHMWTLARPTGSTERSVLPVAGDDPTPEAARAKQLVIAFLDRVGWGAYDVGPLAEGWRFQRDTPAYVRPYDPDELAYWPPRSDGRQVTAEQMAELIAGAKRYRDM